MAKNQKKFLDASGVTHLAKMLDNYPDNEILGTVIDSIQGELEKKAEKNEIPEVPVQDVRINGTSIAANGVAEIPITNDTPQGLVPWNRLTGVGLYKDNYGWVRVQSASVAQAKAGDNTTIFTSTSSQHASTFYGLAKVAGHDEASSAEPLGTYTPEAKGAIQKMLGVSDLIATEENNLIASKTYKVGDVFTANGKLYKATAAIAQDAAIIPAVEGEEITGANCEEVTVADGFVKKTDIATNNDYGVVKIAAGMGLQFHSSGGLILSTPTSNEIKAGTNTSNAIKASLQHESAFYGLAKAAGDTTQAASDNAVGTYTSDAQSAIQTMLNVPSRTDTVLDTTLSRGRKASTVGTGSFAFGADVIASGVFSHAEGAVTTASGTQSHAEGTNTTASGDYSHAEGYNATASGNYSHAEGRGTKAIKDNSHAEGGGTSASGVSSHAEGGGSTASGEQSHAEGGGSQAQGKNSHAEGGGTTASGQNAHSEGAGSQATGSSSHAEGQGSKANAEAAHAEGNMTEATVFGAHAEGNYTKAKGNSSHAEGYSSIAEGELAHAEGYQTCARGTHSHAEGHNSYGASTQTYSVNGQPYDLIYGASGIGDHSEGYNTVADSSLSITLSDSYGAHAEGVGTVAITNAQHAQGKWNVPDVNLADVVGNGTEETRSNAYALDWTGNGKFAGNVYVGCGTDSSGGTMLPKDVQVNGTSILSSGVANVPKASITTFGVVKVGDNDTGLQLDSSGYFKIAPAGSSYIKSASSDSTSCIYRPITPYLQHESVFYGLAKAAGDTTQSQSSNAVGTYTDSAKAAIKNMLGITQTLTVTVLTQDNVTVTGQTVTVRAVDSTGPIFATAAYEGQPVAFAMPSGFAYHVSVSDTLDRHFNPTTASGIVTNTDISVTLQYSGFSTIRTARDIKAALNAGLDLTDLVGEQITCSKGDDTLKWDVADYDSTTSKIKLLLHDAFGTANMVFEPAQALMWCENGLAAGDYTFADGSTHYYFTLTNAIPAGGQLRADPTSFQTYASQSATSTIETGTVSTTEIAGATDLGTCAQGLLNHMSRVRYGSSNFAESALFGWLNSDAVANTPRVPVTKFSRAYSYAQPGFMNGLDANFVNCLDEVDWLCSTNNVYECPESLGGYTKGIKQAYTVKAKFGLASEMEIFGSYGGNPDGSTVFDLYNGADADDSKKYRGTSAQVWWLRSPFWSYANYERVVLSSGGAHNYYARYSCAVVPACQISRDTEVTE